MTSAIQDKRGTLYLFALLAEIAAAAGDRRRAGALWGAREAELERAPVGRWLHGTVEPDRVLANADAEFEAGRDEGRLLELDDAVTYALASVD
jgi:hypothetical protein